MRSADRYDEQPILNIFEPGERVHARARAVDALLVVTDRRLAVAAEDRLSLNVPMDSLRRVQFDIERGRPATLVLVPDRPIDPPQVLAIPTEELEPAAQALAVIGGHLAPLE